jgi:hypothetical protein
MNVQVADVSIEKIELGTSQLAFSQSAMLPEPVKIGYMMEKNLIGAVANNFLNLDVSDNPAVSQDAVGEFLNIVMGNALSSHGKDSLTALSPPQISEQGVNLQESYQTVFNIVMVTPQEDLVLYFYA